MSALHSITITKLLSSGSFLVIINSGYPAFPVSDLDALASSSLILGLSLCCSSM